MKKCYSLALCLALLAASACTKKPTPIEMLAEAEALNKRISDATKKKDLNVMMETIWHSPDYVVLDIDNFVRGWEAWKASLQSFFTKNPKIIWEMSDAKYAVSGDVVVGSQRWKVTSPVQNGPATISEGLQMDVKALRDGKWVVIAQAFSELSPAKPTPAEMIAAADKLDKQLFEAFNKGDWSAFVDTYWNSPDLVVIDVANMFHGAGAWKDYIENAVKQSPGFKIEFSELHNAVSGDNVTGWGKYTITIPQAKGPAKVISGIRSSVKSRIDSKWVVVADSFAHTGK